MTTATITETTKSYEISHTDPKSFAGMSLEAKLNRNGRWMVIERGPMSISMEERTGNYATKDLAVAHVRRVAGRLGWI